MLGVTFSISFEGQGKETVIDNALQLEHLYRPLLATYPLDVIDAGLRWLELGEYIRSTQFLTFRIYILNARAIDVATAGRFSDAERKLLYQEEDPYAVFIAQQFNADDQALVRYIQYLRQKQGQIVGVSTQMRR